jgi:S1-C subfamily serine protease
MVELFEKSKSSVVYITTSEQVFDLRSRNVLSVPLGTGSGLIWDEQGHVVTNYHVLSGAAEARVRLNDGGEYAAKPVGVSPAHDLAVLKIRVPTNPLLPVPLGTSNELKVGQKVFAIGNPFGLDWTLTTGIVSALDRSLPNEDGSVIEHLIQTDAAINPGNSGGPLLDSAGRLIGINTAIFSPSGAYAGVGFAVPVDTVNRVVPQLITKGSYTRPSLGISVNEELNRELTRRLEVEGVLVLQVQPNSSAAAAGLRGSRIGSDGSLVPGDVILAVNRQAVDSVPRLLARLDDYRIGDEVTLGLLREGRKIEVKAVLKAGN